MSEYILCHPSTFYYLKNNFDSYYLQTKISGPKISDIAISLMGTPIFVDNGLTPTIIEPDYVFPNTRFVTYESKDREWCEPLGIGRVGIKQIGNFLLVKNNTKKYFDFPLRERKIYTSYNLIKNGAY